MSKIKTCPHCGYWAEVSHVMETHSDGSGYEIWQIDCVNCGCETGRREHLEDAIDDWNRRVEGGETVG